MKHEWNEATWRCRACGTAAFSVRAAFACRPFDGCAYVAALAEIAERPSDTEASDAR